MDSIGIKAEAPSGSMQCMRLQGIKWNARKHGGSKRRLWRKIHIGINEQTLEIREIEVTSSSVGDAPMLPDLLNEIMPDQEIDCVRLRAAGRRDPNPCCDPKRLHSAWPTRNRYRRISPSGERGTPASGRFAQQSPSRPEPGLLEYRAKLKPNVSIYGLDLDKLFGETGLGWRP